MRFIILITLTICSLFGSAQFVWQKDHVGQFKKVIQNDVKNFHGQDVLSILNRVSFMTHPKGFDILENYNMTRKGKVVSGTIYIGMPKYYTYEHGPVQKEGEYCILQVHINEPAELMNSQSYLFPEEANHLGLPEMFTDTFIVNEQKFNGYPVGLALSTFARSNDRVYVLNPSHRSCFRQLSQAEYTSFWIGKLGIDIKTETESLATNREDLKQLTGKPEFAAVLQQAEKALDMRENYILFLKAKKEYYSKKLAAMTPEQKKVPARYVFPKEPAIVSNNDGGYTVNMDGHINYEPDEGQPSLSTVPVFTFNKNFFDPSLPPTSIQLFVIEDCYNPEDHVELKEYLDEYFYPRIDYKDIAKLMNR
jgi:hypothetical protein